MFEKGELLFLRGSLYECIYKDEEVLIFFTDDIDRQVIIDGIEETKKIIKKIKKLLDKQN